MELGNVTIKRNCELILVTVCFFGEMARSFSVVFKFHMGLFNISQKEKLQILHVSISFLSYLSTMVYIVEFELGWKIQARVPSDPLIYQFM